MKYFLNKLLKLILINKERREDPIALWDRRKMEFDNPA
jgi:hypothetical protein